MSITIEKAAKAAITNYYDFAKLFSFNATMNGVCGGRGMGKTFGAKKKSIKDALKSIRIVNVEQTVKAQGRNKTKTISVPTVKDVSAQFIYLRRYKEELALAKETFFADIEHLWPGWEFKVNGWKAYASPMKYEGQKNRPWAIIGFFVSLSTAQNYKSVQFPKVTLIVYDEFIVEKGAQYLVNEATKFMNFYNTVDRYQGRTRVLLLANAVAIDNPYFIQYNVDPDKVDQNNFIFMAKKPNGVYYMLWHFPNDDEFQKEVEATDFGRFLKETDPEYVDYAVKNKFSDNNKNMVDSKPSTAKYIYTLETTSGILSIWYDGRSNMFYGHSKRPRAGEDMVVLSEHLMAEGKRLATFQDKTMGMLRTAYRHDRMRFDKASTRNAFLPIFKR